MYLKSGWKKLIFPLRATVPSRSSSSTQAIDGPCSTPGRALSDAPGLEPTEPIRSVTFLSAAQSSRLYVVNLCRHVSSCVASHLARHTKLWSPEASGSLHEQPRQPATSFRPFEWQGK